MSELADYDRHGQSLVVYHHAHRSATARIQAASRLAELAHGVAQTPVGAVIARRGTYRFFLITSMDGGLTVRVAAVENATTKPGRRLVHGSRTRSVSGPRSRRSGPGSRPGARRALMVA